jgi:prevent-host-death family protein
MRKTSLAHAKAHLSELVDDVEHRGKRVIIQRHGKPAAALVPVDVAEPRRMPARMSPGDIRALFSELAKYDDPSTSAVEDLLQSRR